MNTEGEEYIRSKMCPKSVVLFVVQMVLICIIVVAAIVNISMYDKNKEMWISLMSSSLGYVLPSPRLKRSKVKQIELSESVINE